MDLTAIVADSKDTNRVILTDWLRKSTCAAHSLDILVEIIQFGFSHGLMKTWFVTEESNMQWLPNFTDLNNEYQNINERYKDANTCIVATICTKGAVLPMNEASEPQYYAKKLICSD